MAGVKGRSGRKPTIHDSSLLAMTTEYLVANWYKFSKEEKLKIAIPVALKGISDKHEHSGSLDVSGILNRMANATGSN